MIWFIAIVVVILLGLSYIGWIFFKTAIELILNGPLLYFVYLRARLHIFKQNKGMEYAIALLISGMIFLVTYGMFAQLPFWPITSYLVLAYAIAELLIRHEIKYKVLNNVMKREVREITKKKTGLKHIDKEYFYSKEKYKKK